MPEFDDWINATYGADSPVPGAVVDQDISQFVGGLGSGFQPDAVSGGDQSLLTEAAPQAVYGSAPAAAPGVQVIPSGMSASVATSGPNLSDAKTRDVKRAVSDPLDARIAKSDQEVTSEAQATADDLARVTKMGQANALRRGELEAQVADERAQYAQDEAKLQREMVFQEKASRFRAEQKEEAALANYQASIKAYEASNINPGKLWGDMSGGGRFASAVSVFAANMLASKGINTTVMSSLNKAIDDNINAQLNNLDKKKAVTGMMKNVYDAIRADSESDAEAREKLRGMMLNEFKSGVVAKLSAYASDFAKLKAQEVYAAFEGQEAEQLGKVRESLRANIEQGRQFELARMGQEIQARQESARIGIAKRQLALQEKMATQTEAPPMEKPETLVRDPYTGEVIGGTGDKTTATEVQKEWNSVVRGEKAINRLQALTNDLGKIYDGPGRAAFLTKNKAELKSIYEELRFNEAVKLSGLTITDAQLKSLDNIYGGVQNWSKGILGDMTTISTTGKKALRDLDGVKTTLRTRVYEVDPASAARYKGIASEKPTGVSAPEARQSANTAPLPPDTDVMKHSTAFSDANSLRPIEAGKAAPSEESYWYEYNGVRPDEVQGTGEIPRAFGAASSLYDLAAVGDQAAEQALYKLAEDGEVVFAKGKDSVKIKAVGPRREIAKFFVQKLETANQLPQSRPAPAVDLGVIGKPNYVDEFLQGQ